MITSSELTAQPEAKMIEDRDRTRTTEAAILYTTYALIRANILLDSRTAPYMGLRPGSVRMRSAAFYHRYC